MIEFHKDAWYRNWVTGERATLYSWGEKNVKLGLGYKMPAPRQISREEFERDWLCEDPRPYYESR